MTAPMDTETEVDRRSFLADPVRTAAAVAIAAALPGSVGVALGSTAAFPGAASLAAFLTGKADLPAALVGRAIEALAVEDGALPARLQLLWRRIGEARLADVDALRASPLAADSALMAPAMALIRALYLGRVGKGASARVVSYEEALAFRPTIDVTVIPSYARGGPGDWAEDVKPGTVGP